MITPAYLVSIGACSDHVARFAAAFPGGLDLATCDVDATAAAVVAAGLDVQWAAQHIMTPAGRAEYERVVATAWAEYERVDATAWAEYGRVRANARAEYERVAATAWAEYGRVRANARADTAWAEYERVAAPARAEFGRVRATALITAARQHGLRQQPVNTDNPKDKAP